MNRQANQFEYEKKWAQAFLDYLNQKQGSDYIPVKHNNKETPTWADVDIKALSKTGNFPVLYFQLTRDDRLNTIFRNGKYNTPVFDCDNILFAISENEVQTTDAKKKGISNCPHCAIGHDVNKDKIWSLADMDADHVVAWSKGGATSIKNCQMLCKTHNRAKGNR